MPRLALRLENLHRAAHKAVVSVLPRALECFFTTDHHMASPNPTPSKKVEPEKKADFEHSLSRLEEIVQRLESAKLSLDDAMKLFEEGVQLSRDCQKHLEQAEGKVEILLKKAGGGMNTKPFDPEAEQDS
jgi:exodeoxyribonuclease VII small subunit